MLQLRDDSPNVVNYKTEIFLLTEAYIGTK